MVPGTGFFPWTKLGPLPWDHRAITTPDSKVHGDNMGPIWGRQDPGGPHVGPMNFAIWDNACKQTHKNIGQCIIWSHKNDNAAKTKQSTTKRMIVVLLYWSILLISFKVISKLQDCDLSCLNVVWYLPMLPISFRVTLKPPWRIWDRFYQPKTTDDISTIKQRKLKSYV